MSNLEAPFRFDKPHALNSICISPCAQCGETEENRGYIYLESGQPHNIREQPVALQILRESTQDEHEEFTTRSLGRVSFVLAGEVWFYYWVRVLD